MTLLLSPSTPSSLTSSATARTASGSALISSSTRERATNIVPVDGFITTDELTTWNLKQVEKEVMHQTQCDMELHDKNRDGFISFQEYEPPSWALRLRESAAAPGAERTYLPQSLLKKDAFHEVTTSPMTAQHSRRTLIVSSSLRHQPVTTKSYRWMSLRPPNTTNPIASPMAATMSKRGPGGVDAGSDNRVEDPSLNPKVVRVHSTLGGDPSG